MALIKIFEDRYVNLDRIEQIYIEKDIDVWNVFAMIYNGEKLTDIWMGAFFSKKDACKAIKKMYKSVGGKVYDFDPPIN